MSRYGSHWLAAGDRFASAPTCDGSAVSPRAGFAAGRLDFPAEKPVSA
jgi:hypothetical protein